MRWMPACLVPALLLPAFAAAEDPGKIVAGNRITENIPEIPAALSDRLERYQNTRSARPAGWLSDGSGQLVITRFAATDQVHWVRAPGAAREQLTFYEEPVSSAVANPARPGFVFARDVGGSEFWQLYWFDLASREVRLLTDGRSRNERPVWDRSGKRLAFSTTRRNGRDSDVHVVGLEGAASTPVLEREGSWYALDFSPDGRSLLVQQYVSINESRPYVVSLEDGALTPLFDPGHPASYRDAAFALGGRAVVLSSDAGSEFVRLQLRELDGGTLRALTADDWDVEAFVVNRAGDRVAFSRNEDGWSVPHLVSLADGRELPLPPLPRGVARPVSFAPDDRTVSFAVSAADAPGDVYAATPGEPAATRWTRSETGGLDPERFVTPELVRFPTFDQVDGKARTIPAFYFRPSRPPGEDGYPVVVQIHGGPESQSRPVFNPSHQFLLNELGIAVLVPNVRGSAGYGKTYLTLDNAAKREDSVRDIGALLDWIATRPELDESRVGVAGGSYGGYMVLASMAHFDARLRAGIDVVGISNFVTFLENTQDYRRHLRRAEYGDETDPEMRAHLERISPSRNAAKITRPLFVAQGANDPRVPASESEQIVRTVQGNGGEVWYLLFQDEGHGFRKKPNRDFYEAAAMLFWQQHLLDSE